MRESWELSTLPGEDTLVVTVVKGTEEEETVGDHRKLVDVSDLRWVLGLDHI